VVVSIGPAQASETIRTGSPWVPTAAFWSRRGYRRTAAVAKILKAIADEEKPGLIILGKQAIDDDSTRPARCWQPCSAGRRRPSPPGSKSMEPI